MNKRTSPNRRKASRRRVREKVTDPHRLARIFLSTHTHDGHYTLRYWRHEFWLWDGQRYEVLCNGDLDAKVAAVIKEEFDAWASTWDKRVPQVNRGLISNVRLALASLVLVPSDVNQPAWLGPKGEQRSYLAVANGLLELDRLLSRGTSTVRPHSPLWFSSVCLPYAYDPAATCPQWHRFLNEVLESDAERIQLLQEWFGYCLTPDTSQQKFLVAEGEGANGRSVVMNVLSGMVGEQNVSHVPLELFGQRFQLTPTLGKLVNITTEVEQLEKVAEGTLKQFTGGDRMYFDRKGIPGVEGYPTARLTIAANNRPRFRDRSLGLWRRMILLPFRVTIPEHRQDKELAHKLRAELPGILNWAIEGLRRLKERGRFAIPEIVRKSVREYQREVNPTRVFLTEHCRATKRRYVRCQRLYVRYSDWCGARGYRAVDEAQFGKEVKRVFPAVQRKKVSRDGSRHWAYVGITLKKNAVAP